MFNKKVSSIKDVTWADTSLMSNPGVYTVSKHNYPYTTRGVDLRGQTANKFVLDESHPDALIKLLVNPSQIASPMKEFEEGRMAKIGRQGRTFPIPYAFEQGLTPFFKKKDVTKILGKDSVKKRAAELFAILCPDGEELKPYTPEVVCKRLMKDTQCVGYDGRKSDPDVMAAAIADLHKSLDEFLLVSTGWRDQRNKKDAYKNPIPRPTFNPHLQYMLRVGAYIYPLLDAAKRFANTEVLASPYAAMTGPYKLGEDLSTWLRTPENGSTMGAFQSFSFDLRHCDANFGKASFELFLDLVQDCFPAEYRGEFRELIIAALKLRLIVDKDHLLTPVDLWDCLFSGLLFTNFAESTVLWAIVTTLVEKRFHLAFFDVDKKAYKICSVNRFGTVKVIVNGDDVSILVKAPKEFRVVTGVRGTELVEPAETVTKFFESVGYEAAMDKCNHLYNHWLFGMKMYGDAARGEGDNRRFLPVYSMAAALNAVMNPEKPPVLTDEEELKRVAMIMDQTVGHSTFNAVVTAIAQRMEAKHGSGLKDKLLNIIAGLDEVNLSPEHRAYSFQDESWDSETSPFLTALCIALGMTDEEISIHRYIGKTVRELKVACWKARVMVDRDGHLTDESRYIIERLLACEPKAEAYTSMAATFFGFEDAPLAVRMPQNYVHSALFSENMVHDEPNSILLVKNTTGAPRTWSSTDVLTSDPEDFGDM